MFSLISTGQRRRVSSANFMYYPMPELHPDRVLKEHDLIYLLEGGWEIIEDRQKYPMEPGDVLFLTAGRHHYGEANCLPGTRTMYIHIAAAEGDGKDSPAALRIPTLTRAAAPHLRRDFRQIVNEYYTPGPQRETRLSALLDLLLCDLAETPENAPKPWPVDAVRAILLKNPEINHTAGEIAAALGISDRRLRYLFQTACGMPLHRYQLELKLDMARQMLITEPERTLAEAAETFGFTDAFHLSHAYKRRFGHAPREDR